MSTVHFEPLFPTPSCVHLMSLFTELMCPMKTCTFCFFFILAHVLFAYLNQWLGAVPLKNGNEIQCYPERGKVNKIIFNYSKIDSIMTIVVCDKGETLNNYKTIQYKSKHNQLKQWTEEESKTKLLKE